MLSFEDFYKSVNKELPGFDRESLRRVYEHKDFRPMVSSLEKDMKPMSDKARIATEKEVTKRHKLDAKMKFEHDMADLVANKPERDAVMKMAEQVLSGLERDIKSGMEPGKAKEVAKVRALNSKTAKKLINATYRHNKKFASMFRKAISNFINSKATQLLLAAGTGVAGASIVNTTTGTSKKKGTGKGGGNSNPKSNLGWI